jgi:tetratricopeptide (TPR) repeat protein
VNAYLFRASAHNAKKSYDEALHDYQKAVQLRPDNVQTHLYLAGQYRYLGETHSSPELREKALAEYREVLKLDPQNKDAKEAIEGGMLTAVLELRSSRMYRDGPYVKITGEVSNISDRSYEGIIAVGQFYDGKGSLVKTSEARLDQDVLAPRTISAFTVMTSDDPSIGRWTIQFKTAGGASLPTRRP